MAFIFKPLEIPEVVLIAPKVYEDERGYFLETYKASEFEAQGLPGTFVQDNHSYSRPGVLRGLHYQLPPKEQGKLVRCIRGRVWDVAVDIRRGSPWFGKWVAVELSEQNKYLLWVPPGFAHGFVALEESEVLYKVTQEYAPEYDRGIRWDDPQLAIPWPVSNPLLSPRDQKWPSLSEAEIFDYRGEA